MIAIIETTINIPSNLIDFARNFKEWGHSDATFLIIGDLKSPPEIRDIEGRLKQEGFQAEYWDVGKQVKLKHRLIERIPFNSDKRRNIGTLLALRYGADWAIYLDDDNYPTQEDFLSLHTTPDKHQHITSSNHWYNTGQLTETRTRIFLRGFPISKRFEPQSIMLIDNTPRALVANQGLCLETPDVDAMTHIVLGSEKCTSLKQSVVLELGTFIPMNSQNTAIRRQALPAYYIPNFSGRNADIIAGYIFQKVAHSMGDVVSAGSPCTKHIRNQHDFLKDMEWEMPSFRVIEGMLPLLEGEDIEGNSYLECYSNLLAELADILPQEVWLDMVNWSQEIA